MRSIVKVVAVVPLLCLAVLVGQGVQSIGLTGPTLDLVALLVGLTVAAGILYGLSGAWGFCRRSYERAEEGERAIATLAERERVEWERERERDERARKRKRGGGRGRR